jgi:preprotein translocase subunit SecE
MTKENAVSVKKTSLTDFVKQVRFETKKVTWPTRQETIVTSIMVVLIAVIMAILFLMVDGLIGVAIRWILG